MRTIVAIVSYLLLLYIYLYSGNKDDSPGYWYAWYAHEKSAYHL